MRLVHSRDTGTEKTVRSLLHALGFRFRVHRKDLPGNPDIVLAKYRTVIFVHGCFWHRHAGCSRATTPEANRDYWVRKFDRTVKRDRKNVKALHSQGWRVVTVWECELRNTARLAEKLAMTLKAGSPFFQDGMLPVQMAAESPSSYTTGQVSDDKRRSERQK